MFKCPHLHVMFFSFLFSYALFKLQTLLKKLLTRQNKTFQCKSPIFIKPM